jgi:GTPase SAR1 family protein
MLDKMQEFLACGESDLEFHAQEILDLQETYEDGLLTKEEYEELLQDIEVTVEVNTRCNEVVMKANFLKALNLISKAL